MYLLLSVYLLFGWSSFSVCYAQDVQELDSTSMIKMEDQLFEQLASLKSKSHNLTLELNQLQQEVKISKQTCQDLQNHLESTLTRFEQCAQNLTNTESKLVETKTKLTKLWIFTIIFLVLFVLIRIGTIILRAKGIKLPDIVNILL